MYSFWNAKRRYRVLGYFALMALAALAPGRVGTKETTLYVFPSSGSKGCYPAGTLLLDPAGILYGAATLCGGVSGTTNKGTLFKLTPPAPGQTRWTFSLIFTFGGGFQGSFPSGSLIQDQAGALLGTAETDGRNMQGVVFKLTPPSPGTTKWTETILHAFNYFPEINADDGAVPKGGVIADSNGVLYGTTLTGGSPNDPSLVGFGTVFKLAPPAPGKTHWTETVLYRFKGGTDGQNPISGLARDSAGALYGTTHYGGKGMCTQPDGTVVGCGTVFKLTPPAAGQTAWTKTTVYEFSGGADGGLPEGKLLLDSSGALSGTAFLGGKGGCTDDSFTLIGCGVVFRLNPPAGGSTSWTESILHDFQGRPDGASPQGGVIADAAGNLYGAASVGGSGGCVDAIDRPVGCGMVFKLSVPPAGQTGWSETVLYNFQNSNDGNTPIGELAKDANGNLFGATYQGTPSLFGAIFEITP